MRLISLLRNIGRDDMILTDAERLCACIAPVAVIALALWWFGLATVGTFLFWFTLTVTLPVAIFVAIASSSHG